ncbi:sucrase ferredoxin [Corynebacterium sp. 320]|uniref:sucrase ferredoxin n=1 Tax=Corynebacterium TaxID=1716 RepID=UPI00125CCF4A|nr:MULTISPECIES: sucrase ferredoxin [Corynebacterium]KAB1504231.1 sucrase ferredoxin [Corynebacterium sp. 320]KAB1552669.1 sucrase ferredoxin [Corynebacterium sp. 321]KAB1554113.1 sucrase ferredoxin [Corynebacterium sp. 319]KAB3528367.1 sucrase ferredoxin [Corynebacterium sp. 250]KAB3540143.1 sucrase ferredoxin [Corynebacterium sp. 366]
MPTQRNPRAGQCVTPPGARTDVSENLDAATLCSSGSNEPLPGTAKPGRVVLALEHFGGWGRDILDGEALGEELTAQVKAYLAEHGAQLQFIRKPGKAGQERQERSTRSLYIAWCTGTTDSTPVLERLEITEPADLLSVDLSQPGNTPGAEREDGSLLLVCTHGKRDRCCAVFGRPVALELAQRYSNVWESSHTKGHRFAPSMILLPSNYSYGHLTTDQAAAVLDAAATNRIALTGNRGKGTLDPASQVAELAVLTELTDDHTVDADLLNVYRPGDTTPAHLAGKGPKEKERTTRTVELDTDTAELGADSATPTRWTVHLEQQVVGPVISSCGDPSKNSTVWVPVSVTPLP